MGGYPDLYNHFLSCAMRSLLTKLSSKGKSLGQTLLLFPLFLVTTIPAWLIVVVASLLAVWFYDRGWWPLGALFRIVETLLGLSLLLGTVVFFVYWLVQVARGIFGFESKE